MTRERTVTASIRLILFGAALASVAACRSERGTAGREAASQTAAPAQNAARPATRYGVGRPATPAEIAAWDIDVNPTGKGLPPGRGTAEEGARVFATNCAACHGTKGEGLPTAPALVGREPREGFPFGQSLKHVRTVGNYWPYATTLYDYITRAMPATSPGSLTPDQTYAVVAWILAQNELIPPATVIDATSLPKVRMPARDRFVPDDRRPGGEFR
jgi:S-disulfanyl-L-cysteine oxidoreductase SoxD